MISEQVLAQLLDGQVVEFRQSADGAWIQLQLQLPERIWKINEGAEFRSGPSEFRSIPNADFYGILLSLYKHEWRIPSARRGFVEALQWVREGKLIGRENLNGPAVRLGDEDKFLSWFVKLEDVEAKDWVVK